MHPDVVIVDYADLIMPQTRQKERRFELGATFRSLRQIAKDFECAVWTGSQTNKEGYDQPVISLKTISESGEKAQIADVIIGLCQTDQEASKKRMRAIILKNRQGGFKRKAINCIFKSDTQMIKQSPLQDRRVTGTPKRQK